MNRRVPASRAVGAKWIICTLLIAVVLASCDVQLDVDIQQSIIIYRNGAWTADVTVRLASELVELIEAQQSLDSQIDDLLITEYLPDLEEANVDISWTSETNEFGDLIYEIEMDGRGLDSLKAALFSTDTHLEVVQVDGSRRVVLSHRIGYPESVARSYVLTLTGGRIISSNGQLVGDDTVRWVNPSGRIEAVLTEKFALSMGESFTLLGLCVLIIIVAVGATAVFLIAKRRGGVFGLPAIRDPDDSVQG